MDNSLSDVVKVKSYPQVSSFRCLMGPDWLVLIEVRSKGRSDSGDGMADETLFIVIRLDMGFV